MSYKSFSRRQVLTRLLWLWKWGNALLYLRIIAHKTFYQSTTRFQAVCLEVDLAPSSIMEYRPQSGPEQCKYFCLYAFFYVFKVYGIASFSVCFYSYKFQKIGTYVNASQYSSMGPSILSSVLYKHKQNEHIRYLVSKF